MADIVGELRTMSERGVFTSADETAQVSPALFRLTADEIESLRAENQSWRSLDTIRLDMLRQSAAELRRLQALIDAWAVAVLSWGPGEPMPDALIAAEHALLAAATEEGDRGSR